MKTIVIIALVGIAAIAVLSLTSFSSNDTEVQFRDFLEKYRVGYSNTYEYNYRLGVFQENLDRMVELRLKNPLATFGVNQFADRTPLEMEQMMGFLPVDTSDYVTVTKMSANPVDWSGMWDHVKNQGSCGSCWAFSATATFEARYALSLGKDHIDTYFSEQQLVDCQKTGCFGCSGGWMHLSFDYLKTHGFCTDSQYSYTARDGSCQYDNLGCSSGPSNKDYKELPFGDENALLTELENGPVAVAVDAGAWFAYAGGILTNCGTQINHGVTLVSSTDEYVRIRNSWGSGWGEGGHIRLAINKNTCNYAIKTSIPIF
uniref:Uncharacterized protein n=1 Tax=Euplotes harpa TaxID=151035 RepID=A0A7S3NAZ7_9SPIT|mmetsp:Transcript_25934/g.29939  ORF Transcript_25934/g.29939 Transcript_25934/m.29939 type:complete len:316 (+) Transcript_25934:15-962(+)